jgi:S-formylglutathione hydrolase FrmB
VAAAGLTGASRWQELSLESEALRGNPLGDPAERPLFVWTPPAYDTEPNRRFPVVYLLHAMTGQARAWFNVSPFARSVPEEIEALDPGAVVVLVDGWTALGGSQWIDSPAIGRYGTYLCDDVVGLVDARFRTLASPEHRALAGRSSGGFGAMVWSMLRPDLFGGFATHAGDALFELVYPAEFGAAAQALRNLYGGSFDRFWEDLRSGRPVFANRTDPVLQNVYAAAAAFSPGGDGGVDLPFRIDTGELVPEVWARWLAWDPVRLARERGEELRAARAIWIDAGRGDEYCLDLGATAFHEALLAAGVDPGVVHFELHEGGHRGTNWRLPLSLAFLAERLGPAA